MDIVNGHRLWTPGQAVIREQLFKVTMRYRG